MTENDDRPLAAPGAGLPAIELLVARLMFARRCRSVDADQVSALFREQWAAIRGLVDRCDEAMRGERILIKRLRGMEDSSRRWSVWMTLDHLRITNDAFAMIVSALSRGRVPEEVASTAAVKPSPDAGPASEAEFGSSCQGLLAAVAEAGDLKNPARYPHPWFGPLDAAAWHALSAMHMGIHRKQIEKILEGLGGRASLSVSPGPR